MRDHGLTNLVGLSPQQTLRSRFGDCQPVQDRLFRLSRESAETAQLLSFAGRSQFFEVSHLQFFENRSRLLGAMIASAWSDFSVTLVAEIPELAILSTVHFTEGSAIPFWSLSMMTM